MRIDKFLANMGVGTRNEVKQLLKKGLVNVNEQVIKSPKTHIEPENDKITVRGELIEYIENVYIMLNKPKGYISANPITEDDIQAFKEGVTLSDGKVKPAILTYIDNQTSHVTIYEGKYHQVKRMFHSIQNEVLHLRRIKIADLELDSNLDSGEYRLLTENDFDKLNYK